MLPVPIFVNRRKKVYAERKSSFSNRYQTLYRFEETNVEWIAEHFLGIKEESRGGALSSKQKMQIFLRYLADPGFQTGVGEDMGVHQSTVCKTVQEV